MNYMQLLWHLLRRPGQMFRPVLALWKWLFSIPSTPAHASTSYNRIGMDYRPQVEGIIHHSRNAVVARLGGNVVLKHSRYAWWEHPGSERHPQVQDARNSFSVEEEILQILGDHPRIIRFLGHYKPQGLKFAEADRGNLQQHIDIHSTIPLGTQARWFLQASEAIEYIHSKGVLHLDLRPENFLLYSQPNGQTDLVLCDFGGSKYGDLYGGNLPDAGFHNPGVFHGEPSEAIDIFSLGSIFYNVCSGHRPHQTEGEDFLSYCRRVDDLFEREQFPPVDDLFAGSIIMKCWTGEYTTACLLLVDCRQLYTSLPKVTKEGSVLDDGIGSAKGSG